MNAKLLLILSLSVLIIPCSCNLKKDRHDEIIIEKGKSSDSLIVLLTKRIKKEPDNDVNYFKRAKLYKEQQKYLLAINDMEKAISIQSDIFEYQNLLGELFYETGNLNAAIKAYEKSNKLNPYDDYAPQQIGRIYLIRNEAEFALAYLNEALKIDNYNPLTFSYKALYYLQKKDTNKAISNLQTAVSINPDFFEAYLDLGYLFSLRKDKIALEYLNNALRIEPGNIQALYNRGVYYQNMDSFNKASEDYLEILQQIPDHKSANYNMGYISFLRENYEKAITYFSKVINKMPDYKEAYYGRGLCYKELGKTEKAIKDLEKALSLDPEDKIIATELNKIK